MGSSRTRKGRRRDILKRLMMWSAGNQHLNDFLKRFPNTMQLYCDHHCLMIWTTGNLNDHHCLMIWSAGNLNDLHFLKDFKTPCNLLWSALSDDMNSRGNQHQHYLLLVDLHKSKFIHWISLSDRHCPNSQLGPSSWG